MQSTYVSSLNHDPSPSQSTGLPATTPRSGQTPGWIKLLRALAVLGVLIFGVAPLPIRHFAPMERYVQVAEENDIHPGSLYYSDVPVTRAAEFNSRDTVRYFYDLKKRLHP